MAEADTSRLALISLGANLPSATGPAAQTLEAALQELAALSQAPLLRSRLWRSAPMDCPPGTPDFINAAAAIEPPTGMSPRELLHRLQDIERRYGRQRDGGVNTPRTLDLDLISYGGQQLQDPLLTLPHPRAHLRAFVLCPLAEILPELILPGHQYSIGVLARRLSDSDCQPLSLET